MTIQEIEKLLQLAGNLGIGIIIGGGIVYLLLKFFLPSYLSEKGKNLATKEDIASITEKVESVKTDYAKVLEELRTNNQLMLNEIEREKSIKKEVYLEATEALTRTQNIVASLSNLHINDQNITEGMVNDSGLIAKVQIVGSENTVKAVTTIMSSIGTAILELMLERSALVSRKNEIELLEKYRTKSADEIDRYISIMKNVNLEGSHDQRLWDTINQNIEFEKEQRDNYAQEINDLWSIQNKDHLEFTRKCMDRFFEITTLLPDAVLSIREELDLQISNEAYLDIFNKNIEQGKKVFGDFYESLSKKEA